MDLSKALALAIAELSQPVVTSYDIGRLTFQLYRTKIFRGEPITGFRKEVPDRRDYHKWIRSLVGAGVLQHKGMASSAEIFSVIGKEGAPSEEIACCVDPFGYLSHMSAMEWHGLTDKISSTLYLSSPAPRSWVSFATQRMTKDLGSAQLLTTYRAHHLPLLRRLRLEMAGRKRVRRYASSHLGAFIAIKGRPLRIATIGRTFLDMIRDPNLCGGIYHVLEVYQKHAERNLQLIVSEIDQHGMPIDKVRAGYILHERLNLPRDVTAKSILRSIEKWKECVQRGGSRKLSADHEYSSRYSEEWCLSLNIEESAED